MKQRVQVAVLLLAALWAISGPAAEAANWSFRGLSGLGTFLTTLFTNLATSFSAFTGLSNLFTSLGTFFGNLFP